MESENLSLLDKYLMKFEPLDLEIVYQVIAPISSGFFVNSVAMFMLLVSKDIKILNFCIFFYTLLEMLKSILLISGNISSR